MTSGSRPSSRKNPASNAIHSCRRIPVGNMRIFVWPSIGWATVIRGTEACQIQVLSSRTMFAQQLVNGLMLGGAYALVAIGYTLIFGVLNLLHLAHGEVFMVGAYVGLALALAGFSPWVTLAGAMLAAATLGILVERVAFRPVRNRGSHVTPLITTIAVGL